MSSRKTRCCIFRLWVRNGSLPRDVSIRVLPFFLKHEHFLFSVSRTVVETPGRRIAKGDTCTNTQTHTLVHAHARTHARTGALEHFCIFGLIEGMALSVNDAPCMVVAKTSGTHLGCHYPQRTAEHHLRGQAHPEHGDRDAPQRLAKHYVRFGIQPKHVERHAIQWPAAHHLWLRSGDMPGSCMCGCCN